MKAILISIQPKWVEKIASGEKTIEVRKTRPKLEVPFKCYIYCTKGESLWLTQKGVKLKTELSGYLLNGKVIGEFVCDRIVGYYPYGLRGFNLSNEVLNNMCLSNKELNEYGKLDRVYGWHISNLKIYDKPKELSEFLIDCKNCGKKYVGDENCWQGCVNGYRRLTRPPQSWCYVEG